MRFEFSKIGTFLGQADTAIELEDDGLRLCMNRVLVIKEGETNPDGFRLVAYENPGLTADVLAMKRERAMIAKRNFDKFGYEEFERVAA